MNPEVGGRKKTSIKQRCCGNQKRTSFRWAPWAFDGDTKASVSWPGAKCCCCITSRGAHGKLPEKQTHFYFLFCLQSDLVIRTWGNRLDVWPAEDIIIFLVPGPSQRLPVGGPGVTGQQIPPHQWFVKASLNARSR